MAELLGSRLRLQLSFRSVKLDVNAGLEVVRAADGQQLKPWEPHRKCSAKLGYFHCKVSRRSLNCNYVVVYYARRSF